MPSLLFFLLQQIHRPYTKNDIIQGQGPGQVPNHSRPGDPLLIPDAREHPITSRLCVAQPHLCTTHSIEDHKKKKRKSMGVSLQGGGMTMSILELLQHIVNEPAPRLSPEGRFPREAEDFVDSCLLKDPDARQTPKDLLVRVLSPFPFIHR